MTITQKTASMQVNRKWVGAIVLAILFITLYIWIQWTDWHVKDLYCQDRDCSKLPVYQPQLNGRDCKTYHHEGYNLSKLPTIPPNFVEKGETAPKHYDTYQVPNIVHYIWYQNKTMELRFDKALSILSAIKHLKPDKVYFHTNMPPKGVYFDMLKNYSIFEVVHRNPPRDVIKHPKYPEDYSDYDRVKILQEQGGIYLDMDVMVVRPFDEVRKYECTVGMENTVKVCAGVIVCAKDHPFLYLWLDAYYNEYEQYKNIWAFLSGNIPSVLIRRYPRLIHVETTKFHRPGLHRNFLGSIWGKRTFAWKNNYAIHTYIRFRPKRIPYPTEKLIRRMDSTYGKIARLVYYGTEKLMP